MKERLIILLGIGMLLPSVCTAQDEEQGGRNAAPVSFELDEEKLSIEADIPSVDLIISFKEIQERDNSMKTSFLEEIIDSAKNEPF